MSIVKVEKWTGGIGLLPMGFFLLKTEAIQLAKDLLNACGISYIMGAPDLSLANLNTASEVADIPHQPSASTFSGMSLDEIQDVAEGRRRTLPACDTDCLFMLIASLAARMKEQNDHPKPGSKFTCPCGLQYIYGKRV